MMDESAATLAENYHKNNAPNLDVGKNFLLRQVTLIPGQSVLDIGCGTGDLTAFLADKVGPQGRVVGIDPDSARIEFANRMFKDVPNLSFICAGICEIPHGDVFDVVISNCVFHWISDEVLLKGLASVREYLMRPGATLAILVPQTVPSIEKTLSLLPLQMQRQAHYNRKGDELPILLKRAGLETVTSKTVEWSFVFQDRGDLREFMYYVTKGMVDLNNDTLIGDHWEKNNIGNYFMRGDYQVFLATK